MASSRDVVPASSPAGGASGFGVLVPDVPDDPATGGVEDEEAWRVGIGRLIVDSGRGRAVSESR